MKGLTSNILSMRKISYLILTLFTISLFSFGCATSYITGEKELILFSEQFEINLGNNFSKEIRKIEPLYPDVDLQEYVDRVGQRVAETSHRPNLPYHFYVINSSMVNAFALPGGPIFIYRGLLERMESEAELAAVLGHEIGHIAARHGIKKLQSVLGVQLLVLGGQIVAVKESKTKEDAEEYGELLKLTTASLNLVLLGYGREHEFQADELGTLYTKKSGYDPEGMVNLLECLRTLEKDRPVVPTYLSTHPPTLARIERTRTQIAYLELEGGNGELRSKEYKANVIRKIENAKQSPGFKLARLVSCKAVKQGAPLEISDVFHPGESEVVVYMWWTDLKKEKEYKVSVEWVDPRGNFFAKDDFNLTAKKNDPEIWDTRTWAWQPGMGKKAQRDNLLGRWQVKVKLNDELMKIHSFTIE